MAAGKAKAAAPMGSVIDPHHGFRPPLGLDDMGIRSLGRNVGATPHSRRGLGAQDRREALRVFGPAHVEIPFIAVAEWLDPASDGMVGEMLIIRRPHGITGIVRFVVAADPLQEFWPAIFCRDLDAVVHEAEADAFLGEGTENLAVIRLNGGMLIAAVAVKYHCIRAVEGVGCLRPAIAIHRCFYTRSFSQALL